jgi:RNA polymerase sigma-70 factor (ECF subfamily)
MDALRTGDIAKFSSLLAEDAVLYQDAGGHRPAAINLIRGRDRILRFYVGVARKGRLHDLSVNWHASMVNGLPGFILIGEDGSVQAVALEFTGERISAIYSVMNPEKLRHLTIH